MNSISLASRLDEFVLLENTIVNAPTSYLIEDAIAQKEGILTDKGALSVNTGKYTGRSPKDKFIVREASSEHDIDWTHNQPFDEAAFTSLYNKVLNYLKATPKRYIFKGYAGADPQSQLTIQVINERAWHNLFAQQLFISPTKEQLATHETAFSVVHAPGFKADPKVDGTHSETFIIISFEQRLILIGGTEYAGEIKKSIFSVMNYLLPNQGILSMHCSANVGLEGDVALFFGLSGTGKTTLSNDPNRKLIGDDEHGWSDYGVFNIEGGCYAKTIHLSREKEPIIWDAISYGTVLENVIVNEETREADFDASTLTENTRAAYKLENLPHIIKPSIASHPTTIIFLTADAFGVLPPISKLTKEQAMYHFLSGYTSKLAGTERGVTSPEATFSTCFGAPFLPLPATVYADLLGQKIDQFQADVFLINTGWTGGPYGEGERIKLSYTRAMVHAALLGDLHEVEVSVDPIFGLRVPQHCPGVPDHVLQPKSSWENKEAYDQKATQLAEKFKSNFEKFIHVSADIREAGPR
ncbi:MAG TPA: phosphoenolpyruvate carboxykinase (ATP) [Candidatus Angelobacter sp.]|nr:phosphoenolpyruvate carboxykinase (ATP) [Candidatus Angelobacter sp.]